MAGNVAEALPTFYSWIPVPTRGHRGEGVGEGEEPTFNEPLGVPGTMPMFLSSNPDGARELSVRAPSVLFNRKQLKLT